MTSPGVTGPGGLLARRAHVPSWMLAAAVAAALAALSAALNWHGGDTPNVLFRIELFKRAGFTVWNAAWYGGHHTVAYSALLPPLGAAVGPAVLGVASAVLAATCFDRLLRSAPAAISPRRATAASLLFAAGTVTNIAVGRLAFAMGLALGLAAVLAGRRNHWWLAGILSVLTPLASPVAGLFLALTWGARLIGRRIAPLTGTSVDPGRADGVSSATSSRQLPAAACCALATVPLALSTLLFPEGGVFPFGPGAFAFMVGINVLALVLIPREQVVLRIGVLLYLAVCTAAFVAPNPLGGNVSRLGMYLLGPLVVAIAPRRRLVLLALPVLLFWQWTPAFDAIFTARHDPSTGAAYHAPLVAFLQHQPQVVGRIEIPFTERHYEAAYVAPVVALARGWERQLDMDRNPIFYEEALDPVRYHQWLLENGVQYVALPDVALDESAFLERDLLLRPQTYLTPVWRNTHWQVWQVVGSPGLVTGPARLVEATPDKIVVDATAPGPVLVRVRWTPYLSVDGPACVRPAGAEWTSLDVREPGRLALHPVLLGERAQC